MRPNAPASAASASSAGASRATRHSPQSSSSLGDFPVSSLVYSTCTALMRSRVRSWILGAIPRATYALNWRPSMYTSTEDTSTPAWVASASAMALRSWAASSGST